MSQTTIEPETVAARTTEGEEGEKQALDTLLRVGRTFSAVPEPRGPRTSQMARRPPEEKGLEATEEKEAKRSDGWCGDHDNDVVVLPVEEILRSLRSSEGVNSNKSEQADEEDDWEEDEEGNEEKSVQRVGKREERVKALSATRAPCDKLVLKAAEE